MTLPLLSTGDAASQAWLFIANNAATAALPQASIQPPIGHSRPAAVGEIIAALYAATIVALPAANHAHRRDLDTNSDRLSPPAISDFTERPTLPPPASMGDHFLITHDTEALVGKAFPKVWLRSVNTPPDNFRPSAFWNGAAAFPIRAFGTTGSSDDWKVLEVATLPTGSAPHQTRSIASLKFECLIAKSQADVEIDIDCQSFAAEAVSDAIKLTQRYDLRGARTIHMSDDGVLTLQWRKGDRGVAMVFSGEGKVAISESSQGKAYSHAPIRISVNDPLPRPYVSVLQSLV